MALLTQPTELVAPPTLIGMLYGQPGSTKTTTGLSAPRPVLLDFDKGLHRIKPQWRVPSLQVNDYQQVIDLLNGDEIDQFDTIVIDTAGKLVDSIVAHIIKKNPKDGNGRGQPSQQGWGTVKSEFSGFVKLVRSKGKSVIFIAHESEEKNGEDTIKRPDIAGSARKDIVKELDFMGYMEMRGDTPVINFQPSDKWYAKNSLSLDPVVKVPTLDDKKPNDFLAKYVFKRSEEKLASDAALRVAYEDHLASIDSMIGKLKTVEDVNTFYSDTMPAMEVIWDSYHYARAQLFEKTKSLNIDFDKTARAFVKGKPPKKEDGKAAAAEAKKEVAPASEAEAAAAKETQPAGDKPAGDGFSN